MEQFVKRIQKQYGPSAILLLKGFVPEPVKAISTGSFVLDYDVLGVGGIARGRVTEIAGKEGSGKTSVCLHTAANAQQVGLKVAFIDAENKLDLTYAAALGVDIDELIISQPANGEVALGVADALCSLEDLGLLIFDSAAALGSKKEQSDKYEDNADVGKPPRMINKFFRRNINVIKENEIAVVFTNQFRSKIGQSWGDNITTTGGWGLQYYSSVLLRLTYIQQIKAGDQVVGQRVKAHAKKSNISKPFQSGVFEIYYGRGIDLGADTLNAALEHSLLSKRGSYYVLPSGEILAHGKAKAVAALNDNRELLDGLIKELRNGQNN